MNIWLINHYAVPPQYYPLARQANFAKYLMRAGHQVTIFAASTVHNSTKNLITGKTAWKEEVVNGVHYVYIKCHNYQGNGISRISNMMEFTLKLPGVCKRFDKPDAIVATSMPPMSCAMGIHLARKYGCRGIAEIADLWPESIVAYGIASKDNPFVHILRHLEKHIYKKADSIVFTMEGGKDYIIEQGWDKANGGPVDINKVHHINNGVDLEVFNYNREHYTFEDPDLDDPNTFKVIYTGSIRAVNDVGILVDVAKILQNNNIIKLLIFGDGDQRQELEDICKKQKITNIVFKGNVEKKYIPSILSKSDLNLMHSHNTPIFRYGMSTNKSFDYLASGKPILGNFVLNYDYITKNGCGIIKDISTSTEYAETILAFSELPAIQKKKFSENALKTAEDYDFKILTEKLIDLL